MAQLTNTQELVDRDAKLDAYLCAPDGEFPNNPRLSVLHYRGVLRLTTRGDPASLVEQLFAAHDWKGSWRDTVYPYAHYHSTAHEVLGCYRGHARVQVGGDGGPELQLNPGDVLVLPAGVAHRKTWEDGKFLVVGAYAGGLSYDMCRKDAPHEHAKEHIRNVPTPAHDPVLGREGQLLKVWRSHKA
jgi:uncharacterized protein YjlB